MADTAPTNDSSELRLKVHQLERNVAALTTEAAQVKNAVQQAAGELKSSAEKLSQAVDSQHGAAGTTPSPAPELSPAEQEAQRKRRWHCYLARSVVMGAAIVGGAFSLRNVWTEEIFIDFRTQAIFLGFIVALTSYLATQIRGIREGISSKTEKGSKKREELLDRWSWVLLAEVSLVCLSVGVLARIVGTPLPLDIQGVTRPGVDLVLVVCLAVSVLYLVAVHVTAWRQASPHGAPRHE